MIWWVLKWCTLDNYGDEETTVSARKCSEQRNAKMAKWGGRLSGQPEVVLCRDLEMVFVQPRSKRLGQWSECTTVSPVHCTQKRVNGLVWPPWVGFLSADGPNLLAAKHLTDKNRMEQDGGSTSRKVHITSYAKLLSTVVGFLFTIRTCKLPFGPFGGGAA